MPTPELFPDKSKIGVFRGFREGGMEFHADLTLPYHQDFRNAPMHGQFVLVQLDTPDEAILGRIAALSTDGKLSWGSGEEYNIRAVQEDRPIPEDLRERYLRYRVNIRVLGVLRASPQGITFISSLRRLPPAGSAVAFPSPPVLQEITGHHAEGATIGHLALGEFFYGPASEVTENWVQVQSDQAQINFPVENLVSRRSFIFARAGFGKSNLTKLLFSSLYSETPTVTKRHDRKVPVGTVIFDPDGEYFWPDDKGRPGFCDVEGMANNLVVFTPRKAPSRFYESFVACDTRLDIRRLPPSDVVGIALEPDRQEQQNVIKLRNLSRPAWTRLVDLAHAHGHDADLGEIRDLLGLRENQEMEALAARANIVRIVRAQHDPSSLLMDMLKLSLREGKLCIVDVSQMSQGQALVLSGLILREIFQHNQKQFTAAEPETIPTIAVVEEAQAVLSDKAAAAQPYIAWVKEGRKYDLGAVLVTQQPGSIPKEILSQGDNWFLFHLLSAGDLKSVSASNAHFGDDLLASLLNEPIPGQGVFWSSAGAKQYPIPLRVRSFESLHTLQDPGFAKTPPDTFARELQRRMRAMSAPAHESEIEQPGTTANEDSEQPGTTANEDSEQPGTTANEDSEQPGTTANEDSEQPGTTANEDSEPGAPQEGQDVFRTIQANAISRLRDDDLCQRIRESGAPWGGIRAFLEGILPEDLDDRGQFAYDMIPEALNRLFGDNGWESFKHDKTGATWVRAHSSP